MVRGHYIPIQYSSSWSEKELMNKFNKIKLHDNIKTNYCKNNNINLIRVPYYERENLENYLTKKLYELGVN